jgi:hypothetical protein
LAYTSVPRKKCKKDKQKQAQTSKAEIEEKAEN